LTHEEGEVILERKNLGRRKEIYPDHGEERVSRLFSGEGHLLPGGEERCGSGGG